MYTAPSESQLSLSKFVTESEVNKCLKNEPSVGNSGKSLHLVRNEGNASLIPILQK